MDIDYDELDRMIDDNWSIYTELDKLGITKERALELADEYIDSVNVLLKKYGIEKQNKLTMIEDICDMADTENDEHVKLVCDFSADTGLLLKELTDDNKIALWYYDVPLAEATYKLIKTRKEKHRLMHEIKKCIKSENTNNESYYKEVFNLLAESGYADGVSDLSILRDNLADIECLINSTKGFDMIAPFVYYQALVRNAKKMLSKQDYSLNPESIFKYKEYSIEKDNGKNFDTYTDYIGLYLDLLDIFPKSDKELCEVCYLAVSNLGVWNNENISADDVPLYIDDKAGLDAYCAFDDGLLEFEFFRKNDVDDKKMEKYSKHHPKLKKAVQTKLHTIQGKKLHYIADNVKEIVKELSIECPVDPSELLVFQACVYEIIFELVSAYCADRFRKLISDKTYIL